MEHRLPVLQHIADSGRRARIVLEHIEFFRPGADNIGADDMCVNPAGRIDADHLRQERDVIGDQFDRNTACTQYLLAMIDVIEEGVDCLDPLFDTARQFAPLVGGQYPRNNVERN